MDFSKFFEQYEALVKQVESVFDTVQQQHSECVRCKPGCADCCHAVFDLTLIEALYIKFHFERRFEGEMREPIIERANKADRTLVRLKRQAYKEHQEGKSEAEFLKRWPLSGLPVPFLIGKIAA
jgi:hypothetical protein